MENLQGGTLALEHRYHVRQRAGLFGFTTVYHAVQEPFEHAVFISVFDPLEQAGADRALFDRIKSAAQKASTLDAAGILRTIDYGELDLGIPFVIWEKPTGDHAKTLADYINARQTMPPREVAQLLNRLSAVLTPAHKAGLPHGSLSTRWIFLPDDQLDQATIGHFQIGLTLREMLAMPSAILSTQLLGPLPPEMFNLTKAPGAAQSAEKESASNGEFSTAADVYALGAIAYEALVGVHPYFDDPTDASDGMIRIKTDDAPDLSRLGIDPAVSDVVARALDRDPAARWPSAEAFASAFATACDPTLQKDAVSQKTATPKHQPKPIRPRHDLAKVDLTEAISTNQSDAHPSHSELHRPHPYLLTALAAALLISNLIWFFAYTQQHDPQKSIQTTTAQPVAPLNTSVLPSGLQLNSNPTGAQIFLLDPDTPQKSTELGATPYSILPSLQQREKATVEIRKPGFENIRIEISNSHAGQDLELSMIPKK